MTTVLAQVRRRRGWTSQRLQHELLKAAERRGLCIAAPSSLRVMISRWENGKQVPDALYTALLEAAYGLPAEALGIAPAVADDEAHEGAVRALVRRAGAADLASELYDYFDGQFAEHARIDNLAGPTYVVDTVVGQLAQLSRFTDRAGLRLAARYAEFAGWLLHDSGETTKALHYTDQGVDLAESARDLPLTVYNLMRKSNVLSSLRQHQRAHAVARKAVTLAAADAPDLLPVSLRQQALCDARAGDEPAARSAFDQALTLVEPQLTGTSLSAYCTRSYVEMEAALCWLTLHRPAEAVAACERALQHWPEHLRRDEALCRARLAVAHVDLHDLDQAMSAARDTIERVRSAPSARTVHMLQLVATKLAPYQADRAVREFTRELAEVA